MGWTAGRGEGAKGALILIGQCHVARRRLSENSRRILIEEAGDSPLAFAMIGDDRNCMMEFLLGSKISVALDWSGGDGGLVSG